ncbi:hypothetical protein WJX81_003010 [Elliptochloris bilobata]|uniref:RING-type E3 ubiquitin transferase n=1 Tax=Elliptochloris bilobata TaxID=381761 RepID=A0AAW1RHH8_9CHLO
MGQATAQELLAATRDFPGITDALAVAALDAGGLDSLTGAKAVQPVAMSAFPANASGTYKGTWHKVEYGERAVRLGWLTRDSGLVIYQLKTTLSQVDGVHDVEGELVVRDGVYVSEDDAAMRLTGVYVAATGRLLAVAEPAAPLLAVPLDAGEGAESLDYRKALRAHAQALAEQPFSREAYARDPKQMRKRCSFRMDMLAYFAKAVNYTLMITALSFVQVVLLIRQMEATATQAAVAKVSLLTVGQQAIMDAYLCLLHLTTGITVEPLFNAFATAAFFEFVTFAIFEMRYLLSIWRARRGSSLDAWAAQRELSLLYVRFYGALLGGIFVTYQLRRWVKLVVFALHSFWLPQIAACARHDARQPLTPAYVLGMSASRLALPLYLYGCPHNLLRVPPSRGFCIALVLYVGAQAAALLAQTRFGPRCFIPARFLPAKYDYHRALTPQRFMRPGPALPLAGGAAAGAAVTAAPAGDVETGDAGVECVICMNTVDVTGDARARMVTPCHHVFHSGCLTRWMDVKQECPTCRRPLPPP